MCLTLTPSVKEPVYVYKLYRLIAKRATGLSLKTPYRGTHYSRVKRGRVICSDRKLAALTDWEKTSERVETGLHVFTEIKGALKALRETSRSNMILVQMTADPKDFVASGKFSAQRSAVYTKLKFHSIIAKRDKADNIVLCV